MGMYPKIKEENSVTTSEKLEFIRQNERRELKELRIFAPQEIQDIPANVLPTEWYDIFAQEDNVLDITHCREYSSKACLNTGISCRNH